MCRGCCTLPGSVGAERRAEIASDLAEHHDSRLDEGWGSARTAREQVWRTVRGVPADLAWRHDVLALGYRSSAAVRALVLATATVASLAVGAFHVAFATYLLGVESLANRSFLDGLGHYANETGSSGAALAAIVVLALGAVVLVACVGRPVAPLAANVATVAIAIWSVLWFWLGAAPIGAVAVIGAVADMVLRAPALRGSA